MQRPSSSAKSGSPGWCSHWHQRTLLQVSGERRGSGIFCFTLLLVLTSGSPGLLLCEWRSSRAAGRHWHYPPAASSAGQTPKSPMPGHRGLYSRSRPNRDSRFPESRDPDQTGIQIRENPDFFPAPQARRARGRGSNLKLGCMSLWPEAATTSPGHRALPQAAVDCPASALRLPTGRQGDVCFSAEIRAECHSGWYANDARVLTDRASALRRDSGDAVDASDMYYCHIYSSTDSDSELCKPARRSQTGFRGSDRDGHGCDVVGRWPPKVHVPTGPSRKN